MLPTYYEYYNPVRIISSDTALDDLPREMERFNALKPIVITDKGVSDVGLAKIVLDKLSKSKIKVGATYTDVPPDSSNVIVNEVVKIYKENGCDSIVAIGGGSVIDTAKGVNIVVTEDSDDLIKFMGAEMLKKPMKPFVVIPTTAGTGSEVTAAAVIANPAKNLKMAFTSNYLLPRLAVLDTRMTQTMPPRITAATAMDALTHAMEAYYCLGKNPISDSTAFFAIKTIRDNVETVIKDGKNQKARLAMANAATLAGTAFSNSMVGMVHGLGHALGGVCHIPHGIAMSIFLPFGMEYNLPKVEQYIAELLMAIGGAEEYAKTPQNERAHRTIAMVRELQQRLNKLCNHPLTLKDVEVPKEKFEEIAEKALNDGSLTFNPAELTKEDAIKVLNEAYG